MPVPKSSQTVERSTGIFICSTQILLFNRLFTEQLEKNENQAE